MTPLIRPPPSANDFECPNMTHIEENTPDEPPQFTRKRKKNNASSVEINKRARVVHATNTRPYPPNRNIPQTNLGLVQAITGGAVSGTVI